MSKKIEKLLGTMSDSQLAKMLGMTRDQVYYRRAQLGIPACRARIDWRPLDHLMGVKSDAEIALTYSVSEASVQARRLKLKREGLLDGLSGRTQIEVAVVRQVPSPRHSSKTEAKRGRPGAKWSDTNLALLGKMSDEELGRRMGLTRMTIWRKRREMGM